MHGTGPLEEELSVLFVDGAVELTLYRGKANLHDGLLLKNKRCFSERKKKGGGGGGVRLSVRCIYLRVQSLKIQKSEKIINRKIQYRINQGPKQKKQEIIHI